MFDEENSGVVEQEEAAPAIDTEETTEEAAAQTEGEGASEEAVQQPTNDQWKEFREQAEHKADAKYQKRMQRYDDMVASRFGKYTNPATGEPVRTVDDYFAALDAQAEMERKRTIESAASQFTPEQRAQFMAAVENNPRQQKLEAQLAEMQDKLNQQEGDRLFAEQMAELRKFDPTVTSLNAIANEPEFEEFDRLVRTGGVTLKQAYKLAFFDKLTQRSGEATKQAAINAAKSTGHLAPAGKGAAPADDGLTDEIIANYKRLNRDMSRSEIAKYHARLTKKG